MDTIFYIIIFVIGTLLGGLYATIIKRMPIHSYCASCGEKLKVFEKIPILSYILLKGKCRHCSKKIEIEYIILEVVTGFLFLGTAYGLNIISDINVTNVISFIFIVLYFSYVILVSGLDKQTRNMPAALLAYGVIISLIYILYLCIIEEVIYRYVIYLVMIVILLLVNIINTKKRAQSSYVIDLLTMLLIMLIFTGESACIASIIGTLISISIYLLIKKIKSKKQRGKTEFHSNLKIAFMIGCLNLLAFLLLINIA